MACNRHRVLGKIYRDKGESEKAIHRLEVALEITSSLNHHTELFWTHYALSELFSKEGRLNDAHAHIGLHVVNNPYHLARASGLQPECWHQQHMFQEAKSEALHALDVFEKLGATNDAEYTRELLGEIYHRVRGIDDGELLETIPLVVCINFVFGLDRRIRLMASKIDSNSSDMTISQITNASPLHPSPIEFLNTATIHPLPFI
jgi:tetratricopeptide (TPR) repeat protein